MPNSLWEPRVSRHNPVTQDTITPGLQQTAGLWMARFAIDPDQLHSLIVD
jgi:hypothetical protein